MLTKPCVLSKGQATFQQVLKDKKNVTYSFNSFIIIMESKQDIRQYLLEMGFECSIVAQVALISRSKEQALDLVMKILEEKQNQQEKLQFPKQKLSTKMVFLVRMDLKMGLGKMAAQVGHATIGAYKSTLQIAQHSQSARITVQTWIQSNQQKQIFKVESQQELYQIVQKAEKQKLIYYVVKDAGRTQIKPGSITVCGLGPASASVLDKITNNLKEL